MVNIALVGQSLLVGLPPTIQSDSLPKSKKEAHGLPASPIVRYRTEGTGTNPVVNSWHGQYHEACDVDEP